MGRWPRQKQQEQPSPLGRTTLGWATWRSSWELGLRWRSSLWSHPWMTCLWMRHSLSWPPAAVPWTPLAPGLKLRRKMGRKFS
uniref:Alternative protein ARHGAP30 n=1 Tax=Homo sapiens TaxID=9606 RepID=L0R4U0_HUMAN|nr:alternative protein ARHGAP30 [Homo sapiens]